MSNEWSLEDFLLHLADRFKAQKPQGPDMGTWWRSAVKEMNEQDLEFILGVLREHSDLVKDSIILQKMKKVVRESLGTI